MAIQVCTGATLMCSFGMAPSTLMAISSATTATSSVVAANIMDFAPMVNIMPFGMCMSPSNPQVAAATAAAMGVLTPMPCIPATVAPWAPGSATVTKGGMPALNNTSKCMCMWGGIIQIIVPGQFTQMVA